MTGRVELVEVAVSGIVYTAVINGDALAAVLVGQAIEFAPETAVSRVWGALRKRRPVQPPPSHAGKTVEVGDARDAGLLHIQVADWLARHEPDPDHRMLTLLRALEREDVRFVRQFPPEGSNEPPFRIVAGLGRFVAALRLRQLEGP